VGGTGINRGVNLLNNKRHPGIVEDYARTFQVLKEIEADVFLAQHPSMYRMDEKLEQLRGGATGNPFIDPEGYRRFLEEEEGNYLKQLEEERSASR
jgi:metallo-beta-lactamase class B